MRSFSNLRSGVSTNGALVVNIFQILRHIRFFRLGNGSTCVPDFFVPFF